MSELPVSPGANVSAPIPWKQFLLECPPGEIRKVTDFFHVSPGGGGLYLNIPEIILFCDSEDCKRKQYFDGPGADSYNCRNASYVLRYTCRNCRKATKEIALRITSLTHPPTTVEVVKFGELPAFGPPIPARLQRLIQPHRELFLKGFRCETRGLGIGAFAYYRRVVEGEKARLIDEIIKVCGKVVGGDKLVPRLERAREEIQFSKAVEDIDDAIPDALRLSGHNPLTLLHSALSKGLHARSDEACLDAAQAIRVVLTAFADRMSEILKETAELQEALKKLFTSKESNATTENEV
jgi:hypothetical protein